ncbi:MAG: hypothetical protein AAF487_06610 [Bacteroidota bacterium]
MKRVFQICLILACLSFLFISVTQVLNAIGILQSIGKNSQQTLNFVHLVHLISIPFGIASCYFQLAHLNQKSIEERHELDEHLIEKLNSRPIGKLHYTHAIYMILVFLLGAYFLPRGYYSSVFNTPVYFEFAFMVFFAISGMIYYFDLRRISESEN